MLSAANATVAAACFGLAGVVLGAYGAHGLSARGLSPDQLSSWQTGVQYLLIHAVGLLAISFGIRLTASPWLEWSAVAWMVGGILFSGSIFMLVLGGPRWLGPVTPIGGVALILGWLILILGALRD
jgi:uncharacterized membrane protein YgdD (TMEM256/DUF423 family)